METAARVFAVGMACPVGLRSQPATAAIDAGITRFKAHDQVVDAVGEPARSSVLSIIDEQSTRTQRAAFLAQHALAETLASASLPLPRRPVRCFVAIPEPRATRIDGDELQRLIGPIDSASGPPVQVEFPAGRRAHSGRAGVFALLLDACEELNSGREDFVVVGGVDSMADPATLEEAADDNRLLGRANQDGVIPGEGAAFVLLALSRSWGGRPALAHLTGVAVGQEAQPKRSREPGTAEGLASVFRALRPSFGGRVDEIFAGTTTEIFFGRELAHAYLRNAPMMPEPFRVDAIGGALGDLGAAAGAMALVRAIVRISMAFPRGRALNRSGLAYASSDGGAVGGCIVTAPSGWPTGRLAQR